MNPHKQEPIGDYDAESSITSSESEDVEGRLVISDIEEEEERYTSGKPRRIIRRARLIHD